ncbi:polysaccharide biosynthesis/export family protein [Dyella sp. C9]|uniref:polysaccharide biosynthesis/export family protein n=1 Tax=Dyella sp. C9 TaxID=2202154 RepID=UPI001E57AB1A|nr:polysaccharide biosynthesis/export family protein [Dyella sp. C9]
MNVRNAVALVAATFLLHGCIWAPGQHMSTNSLMRSADENSRVDIVPITPKQIAMDKAAAATAALPPELLSYKPEPYRIGAGDTLYITVWDHPELTSPAGAQQQTQANGRLVRSDGTLFYPYVGELKVSGLTIEELRKAISDKLAKYVEKPQVDVNIVGYGSQRITFQGAFVKTDPQPMTAVPTTLAQAVGSAYVNVPLADLSGLVLTRDGHDYHIDLDALTNGQKIGEDIYLKPDDHLFLPYNDRHEMYVIGEVNRPSVLSFKTTDMTLTQALGRAGGLNPTTSKGKSVYVIRGLKDSDTVKGTVYQLDARSPDAFILADQFKVKAGDVVFVGPAGVTRWNRFLTQLLPLSSIITNAASAQYNLDH